MASLPNTLDEAERQLEVVQVEPEEVVADKGYHSNKTMTGVKERELRSYVSEPNRGRRKWKNNRDAQKPTYDNRRRISGNRGMRLLRQRGEKVERGFAHLLVTGGLRRVHIRGQEEIRKRMLIHAAAFNLGLLMRKRFGVATPRALQGLATVQAALATQVTTRVSRFFAVFGAISPSLGRISPRQTPKPASCTTTQRPRVCLLSQPSSAGNPFLPRTAREHVDHSHVVKFAEARVNLPRDKANEYRAQARRLREKLEKYLKEHPDFSLRKMLVSGSLAKSTALRSLNDIDVACYIGGVDRPESVPDLLVYLAEQLRNAFPGFSADQVTPQTYSVRVSFRGTGLDVDVVPILYAGDPDWYGNLVSQDDGSFLRTSIPRHLDFALKRRKANEKHFAQVARLLKFWVRVRKQERRTTMSTRTPLARRVSRKRSGGSSTRPSRIGGMRSGSCWSRRVFVPARR